MIEYVFEHNIDHRVIKKADSILKDNGIIAFPTDTSWSIACSIQSAKGIDILRRLKGGLKNYTLSVICNEISQIDTIAHLPNPYFKLIKRLTPGPFVFVLPARKKIEKIINMKRIEIGIRIPNHSIPKELVEIHGSPLFVITASREMTNKDWWDPEFAIENLFDFGWELEEIPEIDLVIDSGEEQPRVLSTVIDMTSDELHILRQGIGELN